MIKHEQHGLLTCMILLASLGSVLGFCPLIASVSKQHCDDSLQYDVEEIVHKKMERVVAGYQIHIDKTMRMMDMEVDLSEKTELCLVGSASRSDMLLSEKTRKKKQVMEKCLNENNAIVKRLLLGWEEVDENLLFQKVDCIASNKFTGNLLMGNGGVTDAEMKETEGYDTAQQIITHAARDWTSSSSPCREATNGWIMRAIVENCSGMDQIRALIPGSGLGRLAYDISTLADFLGSSPDVCVEANDSSVTMAFGSRSILELVRKQAVCKIYPFVSDPQRNEIYSAKRFETEVFPDQEALDSYTKYNLLKDQVPDLTYTVGDFSSTYSHESKSGLYNIVATSFFIDTATNIYEYIFIIKHTLRKEKSSIWVNCGPVQWHPCAMLRPTVDELKNIIEACGFELITWEIAKEAVAYRHPDDFGPVDARYTREEGYRPLRFVACLREYETAHDLNERIEYVEYLNEVANGKVKE